MVERLKKPIFNNTSNEKPDWVQVFGEYIGLEEIPKVDKELNVNINFQKGEVK